MLPSYDVIVVGAGPGGSTAARELAVGGARVLVLDRARFPRDKPCGGAVNGRAASLLPFDLAPVTEQVIYGVRFSLRYHGAFVRRYQRPLAFMTERRRLDAFLLDRACAAGAQLHDGERLRSLEMGNRTVTVRTDGGVYTASALVGADGANGGVATAAAINVGFDWAAALEANAPWDGRAAEWSDTVALDLDIVSGGYGWLFPKGDHLNIGVGGWRHAGPGLRQELMTMCRRYGLPEGQLWGLRGHRLPLRRPGSPLTRGPALLVGDAAGLVDPLSGDGIHGAILSGKLAAAAIRRYLMGKERDVSLYRRLIDQHLMPDLITSRQLKNVFHHAPYPYLVLLRHSRPVWEAFCRVMTGETSYAGLKRRSRPFSYLLDILDAAAGGFQPRGQVDANGSPRGGH